MRHRRIIQDRTDKAAIGQVAALYHVGPPAYLLQDRGKRPRPLATAPAIDQGPPCAVMSRQWPFHMGGDIAGDHGGTDLAGVKGADLFVDCADLGAFFV